MSLIYGGIGWSELTDVKYLNFLRKDLERFPSDEYHATDAGKLQGGVFSIRLRKPPFPQEKCIVDEATGITLIADVRLDYREDLMNKLGLETELKNNYSDTQLLLLAYKKWQRKCVHYLEGDFVFFLYDPKMEGVWAARDPIGMRPLFFVQSDQYCFFSTSIKGLFHLPEIEVKANDQFYLYKLLKVDCPPYTSHIKGIHQLPMGHELVLSAEGFKVSRYFEWKREIDKKATAEDLQEVLRKAVESRIYADYEVGCKLSGGLDSSAVAAFCCQHLNEELPEKKDYTQLHL